MWRDIIGHIPPKPSFSFEPNEMELLSKVITQNNKTVELNAKYQRPPRQEKGQKILRKKNVHFHLGSNAYFLQEIGRFEKILDLIALAEGALAEGHD
jgi:hypothetical protein